MDRYQNLQRHWNFLVFWQLKFKLHWVRIVSDKLHGRAEILLDWPNVLILLGCTRLLTTNNQLNVLKLHNNWLVPLSWEKCPSIRKPSIWLIGKPRKPVLIKFITKLMGHSQYLVKFSPQKVEKFGNILTICNLLCLSFLRCCQYLLGFRFSEICKVYLKLKNLKLIVSYPKITKEW